MTIEIAKASTMIFDKQLLRHPWLLMRFLLHRAHTDSLLRNSIFIMATNVVTASFGYIFWVVATHIYSTYAVGLGAALLSVIALASTLATLGIDSTLVLMLPRRESGNAWSLTLNAGMATGILSGLLAGVIVVVVLPFFGPQFAIVEHYNYAFALIIGVPLTTVSLLLDQTFIAERAAHNKLVRNLGVAVLKIPLLVLPVLLIGQIGALGIVLPWILSMALMLIGGLLLLLRLRRGYRLAIRGIVGQVRSMLSLLAGNEFIDLGGILPYYLLPVFVAARLSPADNAYYYTTLRLAEFFTMGSYAVSMSLFAEGSHAVDDLPRKVRSTILIISIIIGPAMLFCFLGGHYILLLFGPDYAQHGLVLFMIYVASTVPDAITNVYLTVLRVQRRLNFAGLLTVSMGALTLALTWILLPRLGIAGAGLAFLIAQSAGSLVAGADVIRMSRHRHGIRGSSFQSDAGHTEEDGNYVLRDERSANGTFVNGQQLEEMTPRTLQNDNHIGIGEHELIFQDSNSASSGVDVESMPTMVLPKTGGWLLRAPTRGHALTPQHPCPYHPRLVAELPTITVNSSAVAEMTYRTREDELLTSATSDDFSTRSMHGDAAAPGTPGSPASTSSPAVAPPPPSDAVSTPVVSTPSDTGTGVTFSRLTSLPQPTLPDIAPVMAALAALDGQVSSLQAQLATQEAVRNHEADVAQISNQLRAGVRRVSGRMDTTIAGEARSREQLAWAELMQLMEDVMNNPRDIEYVTKLARKARELNKVFQIHQNVLSTLAECTSLLRSLLGEDKNRFKHDMQSVYENPAGVSN